MITPFLQVCYIVFYFYVIDNYKTISDPCTYVILNDIVI